jgi:acyl carrier protein
MTDPTAHRLQEVFRAVFEVAPETDVTGMWQDNTPAWDSVTHVALVTAIESVFDTTLEMDEQLRMTSFDEIMRLLAEKGL